MAVSAGLWLLIGAIVLFRASRPQRTSVAGMWIKAAILMLLASSVISLYQTMHPAPVWQIIVALGVGLLLGVPLGFFRGQRTDVSRTERRGVMSLGPSWITGGIYIAAFAARAAVRHSVPMNSVVGAIVGDALLAFAIGMIGGTYMMVYRKYKVLENETRA